MATNTPPTPAENAFNILKGKSPDAVQLREQVLKSTAEELGPLMARVLDSPDAVKNLRTVENLKTALIESVQTKQREHLANIEKIVDVGIKENMQKLAKNVDGTITARMAQLDKLLAANAPAAPSSTPASATINKAAGKLGTFVSDLLQKMSGIPGIGWIFESFAASTASDTQGAGSKIWESMTGMFFTVGTMMVPKDNPMGKFFIDGANRNNAIQTIRNSLPTGWTLANAEKITALQVNGFIAKCTPPESWPNKLQELCNLAVSSLGDAPNKSLTFSAILGANDIQAKAKVEAEKKDSQKIIDALGGNVDLTLTDGRKASALRSGSGKFAVTLGRELIDLAAGTLKGPEATKLKELLSASEAIHGIEILGTDAPVTLEKQGDNVTIKVPLSTPSPVQQQLGEMAKAMKKTNLLVMRYDPAMGGTIPAIRRQAATAGLTLTWNSEAQLRTPAALGLLPVTELDNAARPIDSRFEYVGNTWTYVTPTA